MTRDELIDALVEKLYPIPTERRLQFDGTYRGPGTGTLQIDGADAAWVDLIHDHVGEESDDY